MQSHYNMRSDLDYIKGKYLLEERITKLINVTYNKIKSFRSRIIRIFTDQQNQLRTHILFSVFVCSSLPIRSILIKFIAKIFTKMKMPV